MAPGATTAINAEYGGFDLVNGPSQGNVLGFFASAQDPFDRGIAATSIASTLGDYSSGSAGDQLSLFRYSTVDGSVTTNAAGDISAWNLNFILWEVDGGSATVCTGPACTPLVALSSLDLGLSITSAAPTPVSLPHVALNGVGSNGTLNINFVDTAFADPGPQQYRSYTGAPGSWTSTRATVPEPIALVLLGGGLGLLTRRRQNRENRQT